LSSFANLAARVLDPANDEPFDLRDGYISQHPPFLCPHVYGWIRVSCPHGSSMAIPMVCNRCDTCLRHRAAVAAAKIRAALEWSGGGVMLTLTSCRGRQWPEMMAAWTQCVRLIRKDAPEAQYACIKERGKHTGMRHLHVILVYWRYIPQARLSAWWKSLNGSPVTWIQRVDPRAGAHYVSKYVRKGPPPNSRSITCSLGFPHWKHVSSWRFLGKIAGVADDCPDLRCTPAGAIVLNSAHCPCLPGNAEQLTWGERLWLALLWVPSLARFPDAPATLSSDVLASGRSCKEPLQLSFISLRRPY
jgi:hypothetical protein